MMKTFLFAATLMLSGAAIAQDAMAPADPMTAPPSATAPADPMPAPDASAPAPAPDAPMPPTDMPATSAPTGTDPAAAPMAGSTDPSTYPVCSRTVMDKCINRADAPKSMKKRAK